MKDDVKTCVDAKLHFFDEFYEIPEYVKEEFEAFAKDTEALGESSENAADFENRYMNEGLMGRFGALIPKCTPKAHNMTREEKQHSRDVALNMMKENKTDIARDVFEDVADQAAVYGEGELIRMRREKMIEEGTFDDYTRMSNSADAAASAGKFLFGKFKKK